MELRGSLVVVDYWKNVTIIHHPPQQATPKSNLNILQPRVRTNCGTDGMSAMGPTKSLSKLGAISAGNQMATVPVGEIPAAVLLSSVVKLLHTIPPETIGAILVGELCPSCDPAQQAVIFELRQLLQVADAGVESFQKAFRLATEGLTENSKLFDEKDPSAVFDALSHLLVTSLPGVRRLFGDGRQQFPIRVAPGVATDLETELGKVLREYASPLLVVTTALADRAKPSTLGSYSVTFPSTLRTFGDNPAGGMSGNGGGGAVYELRAAVVESQPTGGGTSTFATLSGDTLSSAVQGRADVASCVRVLLYSDAAVDCATWRDRAGSSATSSTTASADAVGADVDDVPMNEEQYGQSPVCEDGDEVEEDDEDEDEDGEGEYDDEDEDNDEDGDDLGVEPTSSCKDGVRRRKASGTARPVEYRPTMVACGHRVIAHGRMTARYVRLHTITAMAQFEGKSVEELRHEVRASP